MFKCGQLYVRIIAINLIKKSKHTNCEKKSQIKSSGEEFYSKQSKHNLKKNTDTGGGELEVS